MLTLTNQTGGFRFGVTVVMETKGKMMVAIVSGLLGLWSASAFPAHEIREAKKLYGGDRAASSPNAAIYEYSYETKEHGFKTENSDKDGNVVGSFSYTDVDGSTRTVKYKAGAGIGFVILSDEVTPVVVTHGQADTSQSQLHCSLAPMEEMLSQVPPINKESSPSVSQSIYSPADDATYSFSFEGLDHSRVETSDEEGNVKGSYTYNDSEGQVRKVEYSAGKNTGFVITATKLMAPAQGVDNTQHKGQSTVVHNSVSSYENTPKNQGYKLPVDPYQFEYDAGTHSHSQKGNTEGEVNGEYSYVTADGFKKTIQYTAGDGSGFVITGESTIPLPSAGQPSTPQSLHPTTEVPQRPNHGNSILPRPQQSPSGSQYSFGYDTETHSHSETRLEDGTTEGQYSYLVPHGQVITIKYIVKPDTGFVITEETTSAAPVSQVNYQTSQQHDSTSQYLPIRQSYPEVNAEESPEPYSFDYQTPTHSHSQSQDASGNVEGSYSYLTADGFYVTIKYVAGDDTGYVVVDEKKEPASAELLAILEAESLRKVANDPSSASSIQGSLLSQSDYTAAGPSSNVRPQYSFEYDVGTHSHKESSGSDGLVRGVYKYVRPDGILATVQYESGGEKGFVITNTDEKQAPVDSISTANGQGNLPTRQSSPQPTSTAFNNVGIPQKLPQQSYEFSYDVNTHSHTEKSDEKGNKVGAYSYVTPDGQLLTVSYTAGDEGFKVKDKSLQKIQSTKNKGSQPELISSNTAKPQQSVNPFDKKPGQYSGISSQASKATEYSFQYDALSHARKEKVGADGKVRGSYCYLTAEGKLNTVEYIAGGQDGFIITNEKEEKAPQELMNLLMKTPSVQSYNTENYKSSGLPSQYIIDYDAKSHSRKEQQDGNGNVSGEYTVLTPDHKLRTIQYVASASTGFVITKDVIEDAPEYLTSQKMKPSSMDSFPGISQGYQPQTHAGSAPHIGTQKASSVGAPSYSFSYDAVSHRHQFTSGNPSRKTISPNVSSGSASRKNPSANVSSGHSHPQNAHSSLPSYQHRQSPTVALTTIQQPDIRFNNHVLHTFHSPSQKRYGYRLHQV